MATRLDLGAATPFLRGDTLTLTFRFADENDAPIDITGRSYTLTLKLTGLESDADAAAQVTSVAAAPDSASGLVTLTLDAATTAALLPTRYRYDLQEIEGGTVTTFLYGSLRFAAAVTLL